ncbi:hypothetical protein KR200_011106 [Drosophila serrata]|nr:hypothetical protein KR200_011106 [Drosophila serrata]
MSATQLKDTALKAEESVALLPPPPTAKGVAMHSPTTALSLFDQLKNSVNLNSLTIGAGGTSDTNTTTTTPTPPPVTATTQEATPRTTTADTPTVTRLPAPATPSIADIELKPPAKPARTFSTPSSIGIVQGTKRGAGSVAGGLGAQSAKLDINALRSQLYQGARKTATTTTTITTTTTSTRQGVSKTSTERGSGNRGSKKRCLDRYDSSESSDR